MKRIFITDLMYIACSLIVKKSRIRYRKIHDYKFFSAAYSFGMSG